MNADDRKPDRILIRDLAVRCIIGTMPKERKQPQRVILDLVLDCDLHAAGKSDRLDDTMDYKALKDEVVRFVQASQYFLLERLADRVAALCLKEQRVHAVTVTIDKPGALTQARSVAVEITRRRVRAARRSGP